MSGFAVAKTNLSCHSTRPVVLRFADCTVDIGARRLTRRSREVHLSPKAMELLIALLERRGDAFPKDALLERVWPGVFVSDASLARVVSELRDAIGDSARQWHVLRTVHGFGYAFDAEVVEEQPTPRARTVQPTVTCLLAAPE